MMSGKREGSRPGGKRMVLAALVLFFSAVVLVGTLRVLTLLREYDRGKAAYADLHAYVAMPSSRPTASPPPAPSAEPAEPSQEPQENTIDWPEVDFEALGAINSDIVAWLCIPGTDINYPVVQTGDNDYYLNHLFSKEKNRAGCIFLDCGNDADFSDENSVIYGHEMKNGTMFTPILEYKEQGFYDAHPVGLLLTPGQNYEIQFFSGYVSAVDGNAWDLDFDSQEGFADWLDGARGKSLFTTDVSPTPDDRVVTLSTCTYEFHNARFVLVGVLCPA